MVAALTNFLRLFQFLLFGGDNTERHGPGLAVYASVYSETPDRPPPQGGGDPVCVCLPSPTTARKPARSHWFRLLSTHAALPVSAGATSAPISGRGRLSNGFLGKVQIMGCQ